MNEIIVAILGFVGPLAGSFLGIIGGQKLNEHRISKLEDKSEKMDANHANLKERTTRLEGRVDAVESEITDLKQYHKPN
jgi:hypothetical protein